MNTAFAENQFTTTPARSSRRKYTQEDLERINRIISEARTAGEPLKPLFAKLSEEYNTSPHAIEIRYYSYRREAGLPIRGKIYKPRGRSYRKNLNAVNKCIYDLIMQAYELDLSVPIVKRHIAEYFGISVGSVNNRFYDALNFFKDGKVYIPDPNEEQIHLELSDLVGNLLPSEGVTDVIETGVKKLIDSPTSDQPYSEYQLSDVVNAINQLVKERDMYKRLYEELKADMDKIKSILGV